MKRRLRWTNAIGMIPLYCRTPVDTKKCLIYRDKINFLGP
jgi:hypothetical protein